MEESSDEASGRRETTEIGRGEVLEKDVVAKNVGDVRRSGWGEERVGEGEESEGSDGGEIVGDGGGEEERGEAGEIWEGREKGSDVEREGGCGGGGGGEEEEVEEKERRGRMGIKGCYYYHC